MHGVADPVCVVSQAAMLGSLFSTASVLQFLRPFYFHSFPPV